MTQSGKILYNFLTVLIVAGSLLPGVTTRAASSDTAATTGMYERAKVLSITTTSTAELKIIGGPETGKRITVQYEPAVTGKLSAGDVVVVDKPDSSEDTYYIIDPYRINRLILYILVFFAVAIYFGRRRGAFAILGLVASVLIIFNYLIPKIIAGGSPLGVSLMAAFLIAVISLFVAHGISKRTAIAFAGTIVSLAIAIITDLLLVFTTKLTGTGSEEAAYLQFGTSPVDLQGILLAGILIGVLGILDDITTAQAACVEEIHQANPTLPLTELYRRGLSVGREHIASLINTLVLAYVGVSLPILLLMVSSKGGSLWVVMNSGSMAEEIVRTLVGSLVLVIAVPLTTFLAAYFYSRQPPTAGR